MDWNINWLEPWGAICTESVTFENVLYNEVGEHHILFDKKVTVIARRYDCDDFLFQVHDSEFSYAVVHLTYSMKKEADPKYPITKVFKDIDDWIKRCMIPDNSEYMVWDEG